MPKRRHPPGPMSRRPKWSNQRHLHARPPGNACAPAPLCPSLDGVLTDYRLRIPPPNQGSASRKMATDQQQQQQQQPRKTKGKTWCHVTPESALLERIGLPEEVELFEEFEELARTYTIEAPFVSRSQIELMFDVYDGRKLSQGGSANGDLQPAGPSGENSQQDNDYKLSLPSADLSKQHQPLARRSVSGLKAIAKRGKRSRSRSRMIGHNLTWCRLLFAHHNQSATSDKAGAGAGAANSAARRRPTGGLQCCISRSETGQDLWLSPSASSVGGNWTTGSSKNAACLSDEYLNAALHDSDEEATGADQQEEAELRAEVVQLIGPLLHRLRRSSTLSLDGQQLEQQQQVIALEGAVGAVGRISVCLFDMKKRTIRLKLEAENGRRWSKVESALEDLRWRFRTKFRREPPDCGHLGRYFDQRHLSRTSVLAGERCTQSERLSRENFDRLIGLTKDSLNHLIDAQLLLRNKLSSELQQQQQQLQPAHLQPAQQQQCLIARENEYESLLRNNFNLLKVWQNFEETKRLACFVCEPIKANLADLFWFSRQRFANSGGSSSSSTRSGADDRCLLSSPLVSLDAIQVKRGLIQILEALHYLHAICKLVHRNVTPNNILVAASDNWKLSGLQFAIRFESATISESASIMASEGSNMLRYSTSASCQSSSGCSAAAANRLRRQRTLHQTKCEEFARRPKTGGHALLQPDVDYLAPEIWKSSKCSHKSDLFSYGLILGQSYDLFRHKPPISCRSNMDSYERELKKLVERRKLKLSRLVPLEMREVLLTTLECEPNLRPSANYALQLFRRPIELCKANDDSLRHLRRSLRFLDSTCPVGSSSFAQQPALAAVQQQTSHSTTTTTITTNPSAASSSSPASQVVAAAKVGAPRRSGRVSYFKKVTSASANQAPRSRQQSKTLHLLNLLLRGVDSLAQMGATLNSTCSEVGSNANLATTATTSQFASLQSQFECTFESLRQLFGVPAQNHTASSLPSAANLVPNYTAAGEESPASAMDSPHELASLFAASKPADQRSLMLVIALHRRLLDQLGRMRQELPPVCRLAAANSPANRPGPKHRALAELEEKLYTLVSRHSLRRLSPVLTDPLLKLDEFLLLYELIGDLFAFVGQKCRQNFLQRGKQLLNELTPITGCPSSSSSEDEESEENFTGINQQLNNEQQQQQQQQHDTGAQANRSFLLGASRETLSNLPSSLYQQQQQQQPADLHLSNSPRMAHSNSNRRFSEYPDQQPRSHHSIGLADHSSSVSRQHRASAGDFLLQQPQLPTRISITAPSPMGSLRDININHHNHNHNNQHHNKSNHRQNFTTSDLCDRTGELSLGPTRVDSPAGVCNEHDEMAEDGEPEQERSRSASDQGVDRMGDKSRSQLIDELLRTINDDSFTADYINFNNGNHHQQQQQQHHRAATTTSSVVPGLLNQNQQSASQLANMNRPKSAMDSTQVSANNQQRGRHQQQQQQQQQQQSSSSRPNSLALNQQQQQQQQRQGAAPSSTFDNVIRRMSTNLVQNFNKMSSNTQAGDQQQQQQQTSDTSATVTTTTTTTTAANNVRREKSSNYANCLYVDNQVPARRHSDNTINVPRIQVALSSPQAGNSRFGLNQRASVSASKLANKWKLSAKTNQREASDKLSPNLSGALGYMRRHSSGNTTGNDQRQSNGGGQTSSGNLLLNASPFKTKSSSNLGLDFLLSNRSMKRRCSAASMLGHQTQRKAENLIDAGMKSVQNMFG